MFRTTVLIALLATPLAAQDKAALCDIQGEIVNAAVAERVGGADAQSASENVAEALPDDKANFKPAVEPIVQWVYTLEAEHLTEEVARSYIAACLEQ